MSNTSTVTALHRGGTLPASERWVSAQTRDWPLQTDWSRLLRDLTSCGVVRLEIGNPAVRLKTLAEPWSANADDGLACVSGPGLLLAGLTDRWAYASICRQCSSRPFEHVDVSDHRGNRLLRISLTVDSAWSKFHPLLLRQWAQRGRPVMLPGGSRLVRRLADLGESSGLQTCGGLRYDWFDAPRPGCTGSLLDGSLIAPFLEALSDQVSPLGIRVGNSGVIQQYEVALFDWQQTARTLSLRNSLAELTIELDRIAYADLVSGTTNKAMPGVRLYDDAQHCVATLYLPSQAEDSDRTCWQTHLRALST